MLRVYSVLRSTCCYARSTSPRPMCGYQAFLAGVILWCSWCLVRTRARMLGGWWFQGLRLALGTTPEGPVALAWTKIASDRGPSSSLHGRRGAWRDTTRQANQRAQANRAHTEPKPLESWSLARTKAFGAPGILALGPLKTVGRRGGGEAVSVSVPACAWMLGLAGGWLAGGADWRAACWSVVLSRCRAAQAGVGATGGAGGQGQGK